MKEMPSEDVILGLTDPEKIVEEVLFRRFPMEITPEDELVNEQTRHRNAILKASLDFPMLGVSSDKRTGEIIQVAINGRLTRARQTQPGPESRPQAAGPQVGLPDPRAWADQ